MLSSLAHCAAHRKELLCKIELLHNQRTYNRLLGWRRLEGKSKVVSIPQNIATRRMKVFDVDARTSHRWCCSNVDANSQRIKGSPRECSTNVLRYLLNGQADLINGRSQRFMSAPTFQYPCHSCFYLRQDIDEEWSAARDTVQLCYL